MSQLLDEAEARRGYQHGRDVMRGRVKYECPFVGYLGVIPRHHIAVYAEWRKQYLAGWEHEHSIMVIEGKCIDV